MAAHGTEFTAVWEDAFALYQQKTGRDLKDHPVMASMHSIDDLLGEIDTHEQHFTDYRQRKAKLWTILRGAMHGVELVGKLTENALTLTPFSYASPVLGAVLFLVAAAKGVSEAYDTIVDLLSELKDFTARLEEYTKAAIEPKLRRLIIDILTTLLEIFARSEKLIRKERFKQYMAVTFLNGNKKIGDAKGRLQSLIGQETKLVGALTYSTAVDIVKSVDRSEVIIQRTDKTSERNEKKLEAIASLMTDSRRDVQEKEEIELLRQVLDDKILEKVREIHDDIDERRLGGTGDWVQSEKLFQKWTERSDRTLWILGGPGSGKSFLSSRIISHLQELHPPGPSSQCRISTGYFYIKEDDQQLRSVKLLLKAVALQLATNDPVFRKYAAKICRSPEKLGTARRIWENLFLNYFGSQLGRDSAAFILVDGLDEAPKKEREAFMQILLSLEKFQPPQRDHCALHFAVVGRPELRESISSFWGSQIAFIEVSSLKNNADIKSYILTRIDRIKALKLRRIPIEERRVLRGDIIQKLEDGANGMFLWVNLMLDQIYNTSRPSDIMRALTRAPKDLDQMLRHVFERIASDPGVNKQDLNEVLLWVTCAQERLTLGEMDTILKLRPPLGEGLPDLEERLRESLASLFTLSRKDNLTTEQLQLQNFNTSHDKVSRSKIHDPLTLGNEIHQDRYHESEDQEEGYDTSEDILNYDSPMETTYIEFSHASVRDFLLQEGREETRRWPADLGVGVDVDGAQFHMTTLLLSALCDQTHPSLFFDNALTTYALKYSLDHLQHIKRSTLHTSEKLRIIQPLYIAFHDDSVLKQWLSAASSPYGLWSQRWLSDHKRNDCIREWFLDGAMHARDLAMYEIVQMEHAAKWVGPDGDDDDDLANVRLDVWFLHSYIYYRNTHEGKPSLESIVDGSRYDLSGLSLARLRYLASFDGFEKSAIWYRNFAKALQDARYISAALENLVTSLRQDGEDWKTLKTLFSCYVDLGDCAKIVEWGARALAKIPDQEVAARSYCLRQLSYWYRRLQDWDGAIRAALEAMVISPPSESTIWVYINALDAASKSEEIVDLLQNPQDTLYTAEGKGEALLSQVLLDSDAPKIMCRAARKTGKSRTIIPCIQKLLGTRQDAISTAEAIERAYCLTEFQTRYNSDKSDIPRLWEGLLGTIQPEKDSMNEVKDSTIVLLQLCFDEIANKHQRGPGNVMRRAEKLVTDYKLAAASTNTPIDNNVDVLLGTLYQALEKPLIAKACFKPQVLEAIDILTDDYPEDDCYGFNILSQALHRAGECEDAAAAMSVCIAPLDKLKASRKNDRKALEGSASGISMGMRMQQSDQYRYQELIEDFSSLDMNAQEEISSTKQIDYLFHSCDGECGRQNTDWQEMYQCDICYDLIFCDECIKLLKEGNLGFRVCNPKHSFWQIYPYDHKLLDIATEEVSGKIVPRKSWLERLRKEWTD
ncbi:MAG: hypothetical protein Q9220_005742 [cf. Caloplaca sp. 1 TL-2023]